MTSRHVNESILAHYIDGGLADDERLVVDEHLASCDACRQELEKLTRLISRVRTAPAERFRESLRTRMHQEIQATFAENNSNVRVLQPRSQRRNPYWVLGAAALVLISIIGVGQFNRVPTPVPIRMFTAAGLREETVRGAARTADPSAFLETALGLAAAFPDIDVQVEYPAPDTTMLTIVGPARDVTMFTNNLSVHSDEWEGADTADVDAHRLVLELAVRPGRTSNDPE